MTRKHPVLKKTWDLFKNTLRYVCGGSGILLNFAAAQLLNDYEMNTKCPRVLEDVTIGNFFISCFFCMFLRII